MTFDKWLRVLVVMAALTLAAAHEAMACSCPMPGPPCQAVWTADVVFAGTVRSIDTIDGTQASGHPSSKQLVRFDVDRALVNRYRLAPWKSSRIT